MNEHTHIGKFIVRCVFSLLIVIAIFAAIEWAVRQVPNTYRYKFEWMEKHAQDVEVLVMGNSHTLFAIRPEYINGCVFSLANVSQEWDQDLSLLRQWDTRYRKLKAVIMPVSYYLWLSVGLENTSEWHLCRNYKIYMHSELYPTLSKYNLEISEPKTTRNKMGQFLASIGKTSPLSEETYKVLGIDSLGWCSLYTPQLKHLLAQDFDAEAENTANRHDSRCDETRLAHNYEIMKQVAQLCRRHGARLILVTTPQSQAYIRHLKADRLKTIQAATERFCSENGALFLNHMADNRFTDDDFFDGDHLSDIGAEKFTKLLNKEIEGIFSCSSYYN